MGEWLERARFDLSSMHNQTKHRSNGEFVLAARRLSVADQSLSGASLLFVGSFQNCSRFANMRFQVNDGAGVIFDFEMTNFGPNTGFVRIKQMGSGNDKARLKLGRGWSCVRFLQSIL